MIKNKLLKLIFLTKLINKACACSAQILNLGTNDSCGLGTSLDTFKITGGKTAAKGNWLENFSFEIITF